MTSPVGSVAPWRTWPSSSWDPAGRPSPSGLRWCTWAGGTEDGVRFTRVKHLSSPVHRRTRTHEGLHVHLLLLEGAPVLGEAQMLQHSSQVLEVLLVLSGLLVHRRDSRDGLRGRRLRGDERFTAKLQLEQQNHSWNQADGSTEELSRQDLQ